MGRIIVKCVKCGAELRDEQKVCIQCGMRTAAGGHFHIEEKEAWKPSRNVKCAAAGVVALLIIAVVAMSFRIVPPEVVTKQWFDSMISRDYSKAEQYHSQQFMDYMQQNMRDTRAISDELIDRLGGFQTPYTIGAPTFTAPDQATVPVTFTSPDGGPGTITVTLAKFGRKWLVTSEA